MISSDTLENVGAVMQWVVAPIAAFVWLNYAKLQRHDVLIAVLQAETASVQQAHERDIKEIRETSRAIMAKLDSIEEALRK
jgi:hypothetical protein